MTTVYTDVDTFTNPISLIDDSDAPNAANSNVGPKGIANRTRYLYNRTIATLTDPSGLTAITGMVDGDTRAMAGWGFYVYRASSTEAVDNFYVVNGNGGVGRWLQLDYAQTTMRFVEGETLVKQGVAIDLSSASHVTQDPGARVSPSSASGALILTSANVYACRVGDVFMIDYCIPFYLAASSLTSDAVFGVSLRTGTTFTTDTFPIELIDNSAQVTPDLTARLADNGVLYSSTGTVPCRFTASKSATIQPGFNSTVNIRIVLCAACDSAAHGQILQGASMSIAQYRTSR